MTLFQTPAWKHVLPLILTVRKALHNSPANWIPPAILSCLFLTAGCNQGEGTSPEIMNQAQASELQGQDDPMVLPVIPVAVATGVRGPIASFYNATATLEPNKEANVPARISGLILEIAVEEGDLVEENQVLLCIEEAEYIQRLNQAQAEATKQQTRFSRQQKMFKEDLINADEFDAIDNDLKAAEASRELASIELSHARVKAPFGGCIVRRYVDPGQMVNNGTQLFTLSDMSRLLARVHVPAKVFRRIQVDQPVELILDSDQTKLKGQIILISPVIDPTSGTIKVTVAVTEYPENTRPGDFAEVRIETERHPNALLVPLSSVIIDKGEEILFVEKEGRAVRRAVTTGFQNETNIEILDGLADGENLVIQGQRSLKDGQPLKLLDPIEFKPTQSDQGNG